MNIQRTLIASIFVFCALLSLYFSNQQETEVTFASVAANEPLQTIPDTDTPQGTPNPQLRLVADGFTLPVVVTSTGIEGDDRLFVVEKEGIIRIIDGNESVVSTPFLDISSRVENDGERGLLGLAFDPGYETNGYFYVNYSYASGAEEGAETAVGDTIVARFQVTDAPNVADPESFTIILEVAQDFGNHNGGHLAFGPDDYLYIGLGDGGSAGDPNGRAQDRNSLLGSMLRINTIEGSGLPPECDPDGRYSIPEDNPYLFNNDACDEVWAYGLRNPWRYSFDRETGDLYIADVGQNEREEVNFLAADTPGGVNFGWKCFEGFFEFDDSCDELTDYVPPFFDYEHDENGGVSVTGGNVYRGSAYTNMDGYYFFGDFASTRVWHARLVDDAWDVVDLGTLGLRLSSFGEGNDGELYAVDFNGGIYQITDDYGFDLSIRGPALAEVNSPMTFVVTATNVGARDASDLTFVYSIPAGQTYASGGTLAGDSITFDIETLAAGESVDLTFSLIPSASGAVQSGELSLYSPVAPKVTGPGTIEIDVQPELLKRYAPFVLAP